MERLTCREVVNFNIRMVRAVGRGLCRLVQDIRWEHTPPQVVDYGKRERDARAIMETLYALPSDYWPDAMPDDVEMGDFEEASDGTE